MKREGGRADKREGSKEDTGKAGRKGRRECRYY